MKEINNLIADTAVSSRVRLARNIEGLPFPHKLDDDRKNEFAKTVYNELCKSGKFKLSLIAELSPIECEALKEKHLISRELAENRESGAVILNQDETVSVMINEEDHIRAQGFAAGCNLTEAFNKISAADDAISAKLPISFSPELGYITCCPTNLGTGMRASVMLFLPALTINKRINELISSVNKLRLTVRGYYGEGTEASGYMYQISNQVTLGPDEREIIRSVEETIAVISIREAEERQRLMEENPVELRDRIMRAWGILTNAYKIPSGEFTALMSDVKLGAALGIVKLRDPAALNDLLILAKPANLTKRYGKPMTAAERDIYRAEFAAENLQLLQE